MEKLIEKIIDGKIRGSSEFTKNGTEGISISEKLSNSYVEAKHCELLKFYFGFINSHKQLLHIDDKKIQHSEVMRLQDEVSGKQFKFTNRLQGSQDLFSNDIRFVSETQDKSIPTKSGTKNLLWFLGKASLSIFPFLIALAIVSMLRSAVAIGINNISKIAVQIYFTITSIVYFYFYGFLGAYYRELYTYYSLFFSADWILYIFCIIIISGYLKYFNGELQLSREKLSQNNPLGVNNTYFGSKYSSEDLVLISIIHNFRGAWMILVSFILFSFLPDWITKIYGELPNSFARLFN